VDVTAENADGWRRAAHDIAREARAAGFVPVAAAVLGSLLDASRWRWPACLEDRSLVILTCDGRLSARATLALIRLAGRDARPHLVVRGATSEFPPARLVRAASAVHEDPPAALERLARQLTPETLAAQAWDLSGCGPSDEASARARWAVLLAPTAAAETLAQAALARALIAQGRDVEARAALNEAQTGLAEMPPELQQRVASVGAQLTAESPRRSRALVHDFLRVLHICQDVDDEASAIGRVLFFVRERASASLVAFVVRECGQWRAAACAGPLAGRWPAAERAIEAGAAIPPDPTSPIPEGAWPVRYGGTILGALWCRWSTALPVLVEDADALLGLTATATAPTLHGLLERQRPPGEQTDVTELVGESRPMQELRAAVLRAARSPFPVLIEGESGSGKELVARAVHRASPRRERRLSTLNCAALSDDLAEAELFGHAKGAFTGAVADRPGLFEDANGGTLFLDEVSELSSRVQAKLLRVLQEHEVRRLGEAHVRRVDTRVVAATNRPLVREVEEGRFRRDLRYRLDVIRLHVPPLRDRIEDLPLLVRHLWQALAARTGSRAVLSPSALAAFGRYDWPGNVRELQNVLASLIVASPPRGAIGVHHLPAHVARVASFAEATSLSCARREFEVRFVRAALARAGGQQGLAARDLGLTRQGFSKLLARLGLDQQAAGTRSLK
jgi:DNA-binding NtrC family response regulator